MTAESRDLDVAFEVGAALQVAYAGRTRAPAFNSSVVGVIAGGLALDLARLPSTQAPPQPSEPVLLVVRRADQMAAFDAEVLPDAGAPQQLFVTTPVEARRPERREAARGAVAVPLRSGIWLDSDVGSRPIEGASLVDVSVGGVQLRALSPLTVGATVQFAFVLDPDESPIEVQGMVVGVRSGPRGVAPRTHVQFIEVKGQGREQIARFVERVAKRP